MSNVMTRDQVETNKINLRAAFAEKLAPAKYRANNQKNAVMCQRFFTLNEQALDILATENADITYLGNQLYATMKLRDTLRVALAGHTNVEMSVMQHFVLRAVKSLAALVEAGATFKVENVIECAICSDVKPKTSHDGLVLRAQRVKGASTINAQKGQVINVLRVMRMLTEADERKVNVATDFATMLLDALTGYNGDESAIVESDATEE